MGNSALGNRAAEEPEARDEHDAELSDHRALDADEQVVEPPVLEVILDACTSDPSDPTVDDDRLAMVDVAEGTDVPAHRRRGAQRACACPRLRGSCDDDLDPRRDKRGVEVSRRVEGMGALLVDDEPHGNSATSLLCERLREDVADLAWAKSELVDVDGGGGRLDVGEHRRIEAPALDQHLRHRDARVLERERKVMSIDPRGCQEPARVLAESVVRDVDATRRHS